MKKCFAVERYFDEARKSVWSANVIMTNQEKTVRQQTSLFAVHKKTPGNISVSGSHNHLPFSSGFSVYHANRNSFEIVLEIFDCHVNGAQAAFLREPRDMPGDYGLA